MKRLRLTERGGRAFDPQHQPWAPHRHVQPHAHTPTEVGHTKTCTHTLKKKKSEKHNSVAQRYSCISVGKRLRLPQEDRYSRAASRSSLQTASGFMSVLRVSGCHVHEHMEVTNTICLHETGTGLEGCWLTRGCQQPQNPLSCIPLSPFHKLGIGHCYLYDHL